MSNGRGRGVARRLASGPANVVLLLYAIEILPIIAQSTEDAACFLSARHCVVSRRRIERHVENSKAIRRCDEPDVVAQCPPLTCGRNSMIK